MRLQLVQRIIPLWQKLNTGFSSGFFWIPACAGMTREEASIKDRRSEMTRWGVYYALLWIPAYAGMTKRAEGWQKRGRNDKRGAGMIMKHCS